MARAGPHNNPHALCQRFGGSQADRSAAAAAEALDAAKLGEEGAAKKGKKEKVKKAAAPAADRPVDVSRVDLRVGLINKAWKHPGAERCEGG